MASVTAVSETCAGLHASPPAAELKVGVGDGPAEVELGFGLFDGFASGLDPGARIALRILLRRLAAEGRTIIVSSHVLAELDELADRSVFLDAGVSVSEDRVAAAQRTERGWRIRSLDPAALRAALVAAGIADDAIQADPQGLVVPLAGEERAAELLAALVTAGVPVSGFSPAMGDLEHTFLDLNTEAGR